ncbi:MAG TPA: hypothetical protein VJ841_04190 [Candidatus Saccharimonadales bacterium]|nr:hypothetical protein [Candidatus Saccharimonadales bacterium]
MYKRLKSFILLAILLTSSAIGVAVSFSPTANAATANLYLADTMKTADRQIALRNSLALCTTYKVKTIQHPVDGVRSMKDGDGRGNEVSASDLASGDWFYDDSEPQTRAGAIVDPENGKVECRNLFKGRNVAKDLGFDSNVALACAIGLKRTDGSDCVNGDGDRFTATSVSAQGVYGALDRKLGISDYDNAHLYVLAAMTYITTCGGKAVVNVDDANPDQKSNTDKYDKVTVVTGTGATKSVLYTKKNNDTVGFRNKNNGDFSYVEENCEWMKDRMNEYAGAYAAWVKDGHQAPNGDEAGTGVDQSDTDDGSQADVQTCAVEGVGWIICPIVNKFLAPITDAAYAFVAQLLQVQPLTTTDASASVYKAWTTVRDIANVTFVIAFLFIVFSQLTSIGINNYGIKKLLPRLILAAILVNASYWICAVFVDLSNIIGSSTKGLFDGAANQLASPDYKTIAGNSAGQWAVLSGEILILTGALLYLGLSALIPALLTVFVIILITVFTLVLRQALIILLIVISPLAFVAYLLPNTESLFTRWRKLFTTLLLLFPIVGAVFGASKLAGVIITNFAPSSDYKQVFIIIGGLAGVLPLIIVPGLVKGTNALGSAVSGRIGGFLNNPNKGPIDRARRAAEGYRKNREQLRDANALNDGSYRFGQSFKKRSARRQAVLAQRERNLNAARTGYVADTALSNEVSRSQQALSAVSGGRLGGKTQGEQLTGQMARGGGEGGQNAALAYALSQQGKLRADEIQAASAVLQHLDINQADTRALARGEDVGDLKGSSETMRAAAMQRVANTGDVEGMNQLLNHLSEQDQGTAETRTRRQDLVDALSNAKDRPAYLSPGVLAGLRQGNAPELNQTNRDTDSNGNKISLSDQLIVNSINNNTYSPSKLVGTSKDELKAIADVATNTAISSNKTALRDAAQTAQGDGRLVTQIGKNREQFDRIHNLVP